MANQSKLSRLLATTRDPNEIQDWIFSLTPLGIAFVFFYFLVLSMDIANKAQVLIMGAAAGIAGLQAYWVIRGWRKDHISTIMFGLVSIALILGGVALALNIVR